VAYDLLVTNGTIVDGEVLYRDGRHTGALPGKVLRSY